MVLPGSPIPTRRSTSVASRAFLSVDNFREVPSDFTEPTFLGAIFTLFSYALCGFLFFCETSLFFSDESKTVVMMDANQDRMLRINFDVVLQDLPCKYLSVGVWDSFGSERLNITSTVTRSRVDHEGNYQAYTEEELLTLDKSAFTDAEMAEYNQNWGSGAEKHTSFDNVIESHDYTLLNFYAGWCHHCRLFAPEWDKVEQQVNTNPAMLQDKDGKVVSVRVIKINCVDFEQICSQEHVMGFPTVRLYRRSLGPKRSFKAYERGVREMSQVISFMKREIKLHGSGNSEETHFHSFFKDGCRVEGFVEVARVPGTLHFEAADSASQALNFAFTNVSHTVNHLSFSTGGDPARYPSRTPGGFESLVTRIDGQHYITETFHQAPHHYMQVVSTYFERESVSSYQLTHQHRLATVPKNAIPQAKFSYSLAPVEVRVSRSGKKWYEFITSILAIVGGAFTVVGMLQSTTSAANKAVKQKLGKVL